MDANYIEFKNCPICGSKKLKFHSLIYQGWKEYKVFNGKIGKPKNTKYPFGETHYIVSCLDCDFYLEEQDLLEVENGRLFVDKNIYEEEE